MFSEGCRFIGITVSCKGVDVGEGLVKGFATTVGARGCLGTTGLKHMRFKTSDYFCTKINFSTTLLNSEHPTYNTDPCI